jgi:hypothetical protein
MAADASNWLARLHPVIHPRMHTCIADCLALGRRSDCSSLFPAFWPRALASTAACGLGGSWRKRRRWRLATRSTTLLKLKATQVALATTAGKVRVKHGTT